MHNVKNTIEILLMSQLNNPDGSHINQLKARNSAEILSKIILIYNKMQHLSQNKLK